jgi:hypothetical protein
MGTKFKKVTELSDNPLEGVLNIEPNSTEVTRIVYEGEPLVESSEYDNKDNEIEAQIEEIYKKAMEGHETLVEVLEDSEAKYAARIGEVVNQTLNTALSAATAKAAIKKHKDVISAKQNQAPKTVNNNLIVTNRNELVKLIQEQNKKQE